MLTFTIFYFTLDNSDGGKTVLRQLNSQTGSDTDIGEVCEDKSMPRTEHNGFLRHSGKNPGTDASSWCNGIRTFLSFSEVLMLLGLSEQGEKGGDANG
jgi:hypothetical protein